jgi:hypothetical protein
MNNRLMQTARFLLATAMAVTTACTTNSSLTGGTSIPNQIAGVVYTPAGEAAQGVRVTLLSDTARMYVSGSALDSAVSDETGNYVFANVKSGRYSIVASARDSLFVSQRRGLSVLGNGKTVRTADTMAYGGIISGIVGADGASADLFVQIFNSHFQADIGADGTFQLAPIPSGVHTVMTLLRSGRGGQTIVVHADTAGVSAGSETVLDTIVPVALTASAGPLVLDDFEDGNAVNALGCSWWTFNDAADGGQSSVTPAVGADFSQAIDSPGAQASASCAHFKYRLGSSAISYAGMGCNLAQDFNGFFQSRDMSRLKRFSLWLRGSGGTVSAALVPGIAGAGNVTLCTVDSCPAAWTLFSVDVDSLLASGTASDRGNWEKVKRSIIQFDIIGSGAPGADRDVWIDDVTFEFR